MHQLFRTVRLDVFFNLSLRACFLNNNVTEHHIVTRLKNVSAYKLVSSLFT